MKKHISMALLGITALLAGCKKDFFDINQNPNQVTETSVTPDLALAAQLNASASRNAGTYAFLNRWLGYWSASGSYSRSTVEMSYNITNSSFTGIWSGIYYGVNQYRSIEKKSAELDWKFYQGICNIMEAHDVAILVDMYNDIPYTEAFNLGEFLRPKYDKGEDVYKALMAKIDNGVALIKASGSDRNIATQDILFNGNKDNWVKFANTLKLRFLIHTSKTTTFDRAAEIAKIQSNGGGYLGNGLSASVQPGFTDDKGSPFFRTHLFAQNGNEADNYNRANNFILDQMKANQDERYKRLFRDAKALPGQYRGTDYGQLPNDDVNSDRTSGPGYGLAASSTAKMNLLSSTEAMFLQAEAIARGWLPGAAETAFRNAVRESFVTLGVPDAINEYQTYLTGPSARVAWPANPTLDNMIAVITWQKYFALCGIQPNETWNDIRRLKIVQPPLSLAPERGSNPIPIRLLYPQDEYNYNAENSAAQGTISQFTSKIFWDK